MTLRNIDEDYKNAYLAEYHSLRSAGDENLASHVARILHERFGIDVAMPLAKPASTPPKRASAKRRERADQKAPETTKG